MKKIILLFFCFLTLTQVRAQYLKMEHGFLTTKYRNDLGLGFLDIKETRYAVNLGMDYLESKNRYLTSRLGYTEIGGTETPAPGVRVYEFHRYLHASTSMRAFFTQDRVHFFAGAGPYVNLLLEDKSFTESIMREGFTAQTYYGALGELGFNVDIQRFRLGLAAEYRYSIGPAATSPAMKLKNANLGGFFNLGYRLKAVK